MERKLTPVQYVEHETGFIMTEKQREVVKILCEDRTAFLQFHLNKDNTVSWFAVDKDGNLFDKISDKKAKPLEYAGILVRTYKGYFLPEKFKNYFFNNQ